RGAQSDGNIDARAVRRHGRAGPDARARRLHRRRLRRASPRTGDTPRGRGAGGRVRRGAHRRCRRGARGGVGRSAARGARRSRARVRAAVMSALALHDVTLEYSSGGYLVRPIDELDLDVEDWQLVLRLGASGCGKTTLLSALASLLRPAGGTIRLA